MGEKLNNSTIKVILSSQMGYERIAMALIDRGVMPDSDGREPWFLCFSHDEEVIADTLTAFEEAVKVAK